MRYLDSCASNRPVADLLRWSMGAELRYSKGYTDYQAPKNPARQQFSAGLGAARRLRDFTMKVIGAFKR